MQKPSEGGGKNFTFKSVKLFFHIRGFKKEKKIPQKSDSLTITGGGGPFCGGHHPKLPLDRTDMSKLTVITDTWTHERTYYYVTTLIRSCIIRQDLKDL